MGYRELLLNLPVGYDETLLKGRIGEELFISGFTYQIFSKSLDARKRGNIHWQIRAGVFSDELKGGMFEPAPELKIPFKKRNRKVVVTGSGPAGFFAALVLQKAGFRVTIIERGAEVGKREAGIAEFERSGVFNPVCNYAFGEGGAGTFSDGKLTSRSKHISLEKQFILKNYIEAGAPEEIGYLAYPHLGTDNLKIIVKNLRDKFINLGGTILFETLLEDFKFAGTTITEALTNTGTHDAGIFIVAPGHSSVETYRMLLKRGLPFRTKNFALGFRMEHPQEIINLAQWGKTRLPGVKAAEYRLTSNREGRAPVFTFCMCPGGMVVPATPYADTNIVNGMSYYSRGGKFANAACVAGVSPGQFAGNPSPEAALTWLENLEQQFFRFSGNYDAPFCRIKDFINQKETKVVSESSYPFSLRPAPLWNMLPKEIISALKEGLLDFSSKIKGFEAGNLLGLESKTSSPVQAVREPNGSFAGFKNLFIVGEGSGYAGGIISSAADGIKTAMYIAENED